MSQSLSNILIHIIFSTKNREPVIDDIIKSELYAFLVSLSRSLGCFVHKIGGIEDHIHLLVALPRTISVSKLVEDLKKQSSRWIKNKGTKYHSFAWQNGYGAFSISASHQSALENYISNQKEHHKKNSFKDEFRIILQKYNVSYDEKYLWE
jgi:REP element-mobilizing transposase RayT